MKNIKDFNEYNDEQKFNELDVFDFDNISKEDLDSAYIDYEEIYDGIDFHSLDENYIYIKEDSNSKNIFSANEVTKLAQSQLNLKDF